MGGYDPRYLAGVLFFNAGDFFEAHEVWEDLWADSHGDERKFVQGLIHAAVGLHHFSVGNLGGAAKLFRSGRDYMMPVGSPFLGLDVAAFWRGMEECFRPVLGPRPTSGGLGLRPDPALVPAITLDPPPAEWPDPAQFVAPEEDD